MTKTYDRIKNFSNSVPVERTITEIEKMLAKYGAKKIMKEYNGDGDPVRLLFIIMTEHGEMPIQVPVNADKIQKVFKLQVSNKLLPRRYWEGEWSEKQAQRVGWRILLDWLDAQITLLNTQMVKLEEIFLPYYYNTKLDLTLYEMLEQGKFDLKMLEASKEKKD